MKRNLIIYMHLICMFQNYQFSRSTPIIGENVKKAKDDEFPFIASIGELISKKSMKHNHICGGALITSKHVLTAAHCVEAIESSTKDIIILVGSPNLISERSMRHAPSSWITFKQWSMGDKYPKDAKDIAVVVLRERVERIRPALVSNAPATTKVGSSIILAGWGETADQEFPIYLQKALVQVLPRDECEARISTSNSVLFGENDEDNFICTAADPYALAGCGDSGSPLLDENKFLVGINLGRCPKLGRIDPGQVNIGLNIIPYISFLREATRQIDRRRKSINETEPESGLQIYWQEK